MEELPELFKCFNGSYQFYANKSLASVIMADDELNFAEFHALPLDKGLQVALADTDGCFGCFGGNNFLIGRTETGFFAFDSHSRSSDGMLSMFGKSTSVLLNNVSEVFSHLHNIALSIGYSNSIECNLTGVSCKMKSIECVENLLEQNDAGELFERPVSLDQMSVGTHDQNDDLIFISQQQVQFSFLPLPLNLRENLCQKLNVPYISNGDSVNMQCSRTNMTTLRLEKEILGNGNCFFQSCHTALLTLKTFTM